MLPYPQIDPVAVAIGPLQIHWYGLMYLVGIGGAWLLASRRLNKFDPTWTKEKLSDLIFWLAMGVIVGGRLGYVLFYDLSAYIANPLLIFEVWKGGMAFHGGFVGVMIAAWWFGKRNGKSFFQLMDFVAPLVPIGLGAGRIGNFINAELWASRPTCRGPWFSRRTATLRNWRATRRSCISSRWKASHCSSSSICTPASRARLWLFPACSRCSTASSALWSSSSAFLMPSWVIWHGAGSPWVRSSACR